MQVADKQEVINMLDSDTLQAIVEKHQPNMTICDIEAIRTEKLFDFETQGIQVVPSAKAINYMMNRRSICDLAS